MARWLITGATGCVGRAVCAAAVAAGHEVMGLAPRGAPPGWELPVGVVAARVEDSAAVERAVDGRDVVIHLGGWVHRVPRGAAEEAELRRSIVDGSEGVARAARRVGARLVHGSTVAVDEPTPYGRAKRDAEAAVAAVEPGAALVRIVHVYGAHDRGNMARLIRAVLGRRAAVVGDGANRKSMVYVENLADRLVLLTGQRLAGAWVAADGAPTQAEIVGAIAAAAGRRPPPRVPRTLALLGARALDALTRSSVWSDRVDKLMRPTEFDGAPLDEKLGYRPRVSFDEGMRRAVAWVRDHG